MASSVYDIKARIVALPYVAPIEPGPVVIPGLPVTSEASTESETTPASETAAPSESGLKWNATGAIDLTGLKPAINVIGTAKGALEKIEGIIDHVLMPVIKILEFFMSSLDILSAILSTVIKSGISVAESWIKDFSSTGVYMNILIPPGLNSMFMQNPFLAKFTSGGFEGFLKRLEVSMYNTADPNRPVFSDSAQVGGFILMADAESLAQFFKMVKTLADMFDFMKLLPIPDAPPPPPNLRGVCSFNKDGKAVVELTWDAPALPCVAFRVKRSIVNGGVDKKPYPTPTPTKLTGKDGFIAGIKYKKLNGTFPPDKSRVYDVMGEVLVNPVNGGGKYTDESITENDKIFYYVVESGFGDPLWGKPSTQISVPINPKKCIENGIVQIIQHAQGLEPVYIGIGSLGSWTSTNIRDVIPGLPILMDMFLKFLKMLSGMTVTVTASFSSFIEQIKKKFESYVQTLELIEDIITFLYNLELGKLAFLSVPVAEGGVSGFMERIRNAEKPEDGFTGPSGITLGIVFVWGTVTCDPSGDVDTSSIEKANKIIENAFGLFTELFGGG